MIVNVGLAADCQNNNLSMAETGQCEYAKFNQADQKLNSIYKELLNKLDGQGEQKLKESQRAWLKYRDLNAQFVAVSYRYDLDSVYGDLVIMETKTKMTQERVKEFQEAYIQLSR